MSLGRISRKGGDHLLVRVNRDVQYEGKLCLLGSKQHVLVDQIAIQDAGPRLVGRNEGRAMVRKDRLLGCDARKDGLPAAGKARKEMGLDEALGNQKVSLYGELVDQETSARGKGAEVNHVLVLLGLVNHELLVLDQVLAELVDHLFLGRGPVEPGGNQDRNVTVGIIFPNFLQIKGEGDLAGDGPRVIRRDDHNVLLALCELADARTPDGMLQGLLHQLLLGTLGDVLHRLRLQDRRGVRKRKLDLLSSKWELD